MFLSPVVIQFLLGAALLAPSSPAQRLQNLLSDLLILDTHIDTANCIVDEGYQLAEDHSYYQTDIPRLRRGRVGAVFFGVWVEQEFPSQVWVTRTLDLIDALREQVRRNPQDLEMASTADDIVRIHRSGKVAALVGLEGGQLISDSLPVLRDYYRLGVRYMTLTHFKANDWADSSTDPAVHNGLTPLGRDIVREMNRLGMMVDISHVSDKTFYDALEATRAPVIASHSGMRALCNIPRNMNDDMLRALARNGGVVDVIFAKVHLDEKAWVSYIGMLDAYNRDMADMLAVNRDNPRRWELKRAIESDTRRNCPWRTSASFCGTSIMPCR
jgi:membrane dipeptidase